MKLENLIVSNQHTARQKTDRTGQLTTSQHRPNNNHGCVHDGWWRRQGNKEI